eukprot:GHVO01005161.1.p1 GENE.GHVO01005161.1~~GHVO01005161.1.p1  ORF type:complete len:211 (+),score=50.71 GHVO01005161.1:227-859(+)
MGSVGGVRDVFRVLTEMENEIKMYEVKWIPIDPSHIRLIIGQGGATIQKIRNLPGVHRAQVENDKSSIQLVGLPKAVAVADSMIRDIVGAASAPKPAVETTEISHAPRAPKPQPTRKTGQPIQPNDRAAFPDLASTRSPVPKSIRRRGGGYIYKAKTSTTATATATTQSTSTSPGDVTVVASPPLRPPFGEEAPATEPTQLAAEGTDVVA